MKSHFRKIAIVLLSVLLCVISCSCTQSKENSDKANGENNSQTVVTEEKTLEAVREIDRNKALDAVKTQFIAIFHMMVNNPKSYGMQAMADGDINSIKIYDEVVLENRDTLYDEYTSLAFPIEVKGKIVAILSIDTRTYHLSLDVDFVPILEKVNNSQSFQLFQNGETYYLATEDGVFKQEGHSVSEIEKEEYDKFFEKINFDYENTVSFANTLKVNDTYTEAAKQSVLG